MFKSNAKAKATVSRRQPLQQRAIDTIGVILDAMEIEITGRGYESVSTNVVSEKAGVSVGSLYQYFPNKEAIIYSLIQRQVDWQKIKLEGLLDSMGDRPAQEKLQELIRLFLTMNFNNRRLAATFVNQARRLNMGEIIHRIEIDFGGHLLDLVLKGTPFVDHPHYGVRKFIAIKSVASVAYSALVDQSFKADVDLLSVELAALVFDYLRRT